MLARFAKAFTPVQDIRIYRYFLNSCFCHPLPAPHIKNTMRRHDHTCGVVEITATPNYGGFHEEAREGLDRPATLGIRISKLSKKIHNIAYVP